jgi:hypothetical protein
MNSTKRSGTTIDGSNPAAINPTVAGLSNEGVRGNPAPNGDDDPLGSDHVDDEAATIAAERVRSGAADAAEDGSEALERLGISFTEDSDE